MVSLSQIREDFHKKLATIYDSGEIQAFFLIAVEDISGFSPLDYVFQKNTGISQEASQRFREILEALRQEVPIQHILGKAPFYGLTFSVTRHTLIPRPETEELVYAIIQRHQKQDPLNILDIGTGSGCIAVSLAKHLPRATVSAVDISSKALTVASKNAIDLGIDVRFQQLDITRWEEFPSEIGLFDVIVSNPPYIRQSERQEMSNNVLNHEPPTALFVEDSDPLLFYDRISDFATQYLTPSGVLYFEINQYLGRETVALVRKKGFREVELIKDINGADRIVTAHTKPV